MNCMYSSFGRFILGVQYFWHCAAANLFKAVVSIQWNVIVMKRLSFSLTSIISQVTAMVYFCLKKEHLTSHLLPSLSWTAYVLGRPLTFSLATGALQKGLEGLYSQETARYQGLKTRLQWFGGHFFFQDKKRSTKTPWFPGLLNLTWNSYGLFAWTMWISSWSIVWSGDFRKWTGLGHRKCQYCKYLRKQLESFTGGSKKTKKLQKKAACHRSFSSFFSSHPSDLSCKIGARGNLSIPRNRLLSSNRISQTLLTGRANPYIMKDERLDIHSKSLSSRHTIFVGIHSIHEKFFTKGFISIEGLSTETFWVKPP